nr:MAG TPA: hypothetical protein [Caudoviricetes sp.]
MEFITVEDCTSDNILMVEESDVAYANTCLEATAKGMGLAEEEIAIPASALVKHYGTVLAYRERALSMIGSDATVMADGSRSEDIYYQKYKLYDALAKELEGKLDYSSFALDGTDGSGKGGVGIIRLSRA